VGAGLLRLLLDDLPLRLQPADVTLESLLRHTFRGGADDDARLARNDLAQQVLQPLALDVRQLAADPRRATRGDVDQEPPGEADLRGQAGTLVPDRVL